MYVSGDDPCYYPEKNSHLQKLNLTENPMKKDKITVMAVVKLTLYTQCIHKLYTVYTVYKYCFVGLLFV